MRVLLSVFINNNLLDSSLGPTRSACLKLRMPTIIHALLIIELFILSARAHTLDGLLVFHTRADNSSELAETAKTKSTSTFLTSLWINAAIFGATVIALSLLRLPFKEIYEPRTYVPKDKDKRSDPLGRNLVAWPFKVWKIDLEKDKHKIGIDAYMFLCFLRMMLKIFGPIWVVSWGVLMPIDAFSSGSNTTGLERFTFANIGTEKQERYWAHLSCAWVFTLWIGIVILFEMRHFIGKRQDYLLDKNHSDSAQANTILITGIRPEYLNEPALTHIFSNLPGGVRKIWLNRDLKELPDIYDRRMKACNMLEKAETKLVEKAIGIWSKSRGGKEKHRERDPQYHDRERGHRVTRAEKLVPNRDRPKHRLPLKPFPFSVPLLSKRIDTIRWCREEIQETTRLLKHGRHVVDRETGLNADIKVEGLAGMVGVGKFLNHRHNSKSSDSEEESDFVNDNKGLHGSRARRKGQASRRGGHSSRDSDNKPKETYPALNSAFVLFNRQISAHLAVQTLVHHEPFAMSKKYIEVAPADVIWGNLGLLAEEMRMRTVVSYTITAALIVLWSFPVALIGAASNLSTLCDTYSWLSWICALPHTIIGLLQGMLPALLLSALMATLPVILRLLARFEGVPRRTSVELSIMSRFFLFHVIHSFLIVTLSSGLIAALPGLLQNPTSIPSLLAQSLPKASNFFLTYIILQGLSGAGFGYLQLAYFFVYYLKRLTAGSTPRALFKVKYRLQGIKWGTVFPTVTLLAVISIAYMIISPIINGLAAATFFLLYQMYKYRFFYQIGQPAWMDTGGLFFPRAIQHVLVGVYIQQICLCTLFVLARNEASKPSAIPQAIMMLALFIITMVYHSALNRAYDPLLRALPLTKADETNRVPQSRRGRMQRHGRHTGRADPSVDDRLMDFYHPAIAETIRPIWIPHDELGLGIAESEARANKRAHIHSGCRNAVINKKGHVEVTGHPPKWKGKEEDEDD